MADSARDTHKLCIAYGLCCNGAWFGHGELDADEVGQTLAAGLRVKSVGGVDHLGLPCPKFLNGCCSIYEGWRPRVCGAYTCDLLNRYMAGEVGESEAMAHIVSAKAMFERVVAETGELKEGLWGGAVMQRLGSGYGDAAPSLPPLPPEVAMDVVALRVYFQRHFVKPEDGA